LKVCFICKDRKLEAELRSLLQPDGHSLRSCDNLRDALEGDLVPPPDLAIIDFAGGSAEQKSLREFKKAFPGTQVLLLTRASESTSQKNLLLSGARSFMLKPVDLSQLRDVLSVTARTVRRKELQRALSEGKKLRAGFKSIVGESEPLLRSVAVARKVAASAVSSVLLTGESGTGKELFARAIHYGSRRAPFPFVEVDCAGIPLRLMESEVFGHEEGAFTDAKEQKIGLFEVADGGTIFLDEIGETPLELQAKLLRFLDTRKFRPVASSREISVDAMVVAATSRDLEKLIAEGKFRKDLYYRLDVVKIELPPLRERQGDIVLLARHFLKALSRKFQKEVAGLDSDAEAVLLGYNWPGNVRELKNMIERAVLLSRGPYLTADDFPFRSGRGPVAAVRASAGKISVELPDEGVSFAALERNIIQAALAKAGGNVTEAARLLELGRGWMRYRMRKHGIETAELIGEGV